MKNIYFMRAIGIKNMQEKLTQNLGLSCSDLGLTDSLISNPMTLIPVQEIDHWYSLLDEKTGDSNVILKYSKDVQLSRLGAIGRWLLHSDDLISTVRRVNVGLGSLQSGGYLSAAMSGTIIKWCYQNNNFSAQSRVHDSIRLSIFMVKVLREYLGEDYSPIRIMCTGKREDQALYEEHFGCPVEWNHFQTEVWFDSSVRLSTREFGARERPNLAMSYQELDEYLNMPSPDDHVKVIYEVINYLCHYGLPTLEKTASLLGLSIQQFQRQLRAMGLTYTQTMGYVLSQVATKHLRNGHSVDQTAKLMGYENRVSFERMFKKQRGLTPTQYLKLRY